MTFKDGAILSGLLLIRTMCDAALEVFLRCSGEFERVRTDDPAQHCGIGRGRLAQAMTEAGLAAKIKFQKFYTQALLHSTTRSKEAAVRGSHSARSCWLCVSF